MGFGARLTIMAGQRDVVWSGPAAMIMHLRWSLGFLGRVAVWPFRFRVAGGSLPAQGPGNVEALPLGQASTRPQ
jgi:hypothetical protein